MTIEVIQSFLRHLLTAAGGILVSKGYVDGGMVDAGVGALITLIGLGWAVWHKKKVVS